MIVRAPPSVADCGDPRLAFAVGHRRRQAVDVHTSSCAQCEREQMQDGGRITLRREAPQMQVVRYSAQQFGISSIIKINVPNLAPQSRVAFSSIASRTRARALPVSSK